MQHYAHFNASCKLSLTVGFIDEVASLFSLKCLEDLHKILAQSSKSGHREQDRITDNVKIRFAKDKQR